MTSLVLLRQALKVSTMGIRLCFATALLTISLTPTASAAPRRLDLEDVASVVQVSDPQLSPNGKLIVCVVGRPNIKDARYDRSLVLIDIATDIQRVLTYDRKDASNPRWSPSGDRIAFLDASMQTLPNAASGSSAGTLKSQVFVMPMNGGDAHRITNAPSDVEQFAWSPDGTQIAYVTADENPKRRRSSGTTTRSRSETTIISRPRRRCHPTSGSCRPKAARPDA